MDDGTNMGLIEQYGFCQCGAIWDLDDRAHMDTLEQHRQSCGVPRVNLDNATRFYAYVDRERMAVQTNERDRCDGGQSCEYCGSSKRPERGCCAIAELASAIGHELNRQYSKRFRNSELTDWRIDVGTAGERKFIIIVDRH